MVCVWTHHGIAYLGTTWISAVTEAIDGDQHRCCCGVAGWNYNFVHCVLHVLPEDFGCLSKLTFFSAMKNQLKDLPRSMGELSMLQDLDLSENALELLPEEVGNLHNCKELDLSGNRLSSIPDSLGMYFIWEEKDMGLPSFWYSLGPLRPLVSFPRVISINHVILEPNGRDIQKDHAWFSQCLWALTTLWTTLSVSVDQQHCWDLNTIYNDWGSGLAGFG